MMIQLNNPRNNFVDLKDSACPGEICNENQTVCIEKLYLRMNSAARYNSSIQCLFFNAGHRDLNAKKFRVC
jgi:hypothetical protein